MNRVKIPINEIKVEERQRRDLGDIEKLATSLKQYGLIQPIVINQNHRLLAGGRRLAAAVSLGWTEVDVVYRETMSADEAFELELEENVRRKDMSWQERCLTIAKIHSHKVLRAADDLATWGLAQTGELIGVSRAQTQYCIALAEYLKDPDSPVWKEPDMAAAYRLLLRLQQEADEAELARRGLENSTREPRDLVEGPEEASPFLEDLAEPDQDRESAREQYLSNPHNDPNLFDHYWAEKQARRAQAPTVNLSRRLYNEDSCVGQFSWMWQNEWKRTFDHVITDPPYAIDMDMVDQDIGSLTDIDTVLEEHDVEYNIELLNRFVPAAYRVLKDEGFLAMWCDQDCWEMLKQLALKVGFSVQRWPIVWHKLHRCKNGSAQFNFTKRTEIAMICRKGNAVLNHVVDTNVVTASNEDIRKLIPHPFAKPFEVWQFLCEPICRPGQLVLDPFAGKGSGVLSMLQMQLNVFGVEMVPGHYNFMLELVKEHYRKFSPETRFT